jgi:hypothetical protein
MSEELDDFDPEPESAPSWLKDDWDGTIMYARFEQQGQGNWALQLVSIDKATGEEYRHQPISVGGKDKGWTSHDGGEEISGATADQRYHPRTNIAKWIDWCIAAGAKDEMLKRSREKYGRRGRFFADLWMDLEFHYDVVTVTEDRPDKTKEDGRPWIPTKVQVMKPTKFLGVGNGNQLPLSSTPSTTATATATSASTNGSGINEADMATLTLIAMSAETHGEFADAVMDTEDASGTPFTKNPTIRKNLSKKEWWESLKS